MRRAATPANRPTAAVEQGEFDAGLVSEISQRFLGAILRPGRSKLARVFGGVRIANHDLLIAVAIFPVPRKIEQLLHNGGGCV